MDCLKYWLMLSDFKNLKIITKFCLENSLTISNYCTLGVLVLYMVGIFYDVKNTTHILN